MWMRFFLGSLRCTVRFMFARDGLMISGGGNSEVARGECKVRREHGNGTSTEFVVDFGFHGLLLVKF